MEATEATISVLIIGFTFLVIMYVEMFMYKKSLTKKEVADYQAVLNEMDTKAEANYGLKCKHDATTELMKQRKEKKSFTLIFSGIFLAFVFIILACMTTFLTLINIGIISISGIILICYGLIKIAESKGLAIVVLSIIFIIGTVVMLAFNELMASSPYAYWYFCLLVLVIGVFSLITQNKKIRN